MSDINFHKTHVEIIVHNGKTDIYRQGSIVMIANTDIPTYPVYFFYLFFFKYYCDLISNLKINSSEYIFVLCSPQKIP